MCVGWQKSKKKDANANVDGGCECECVYVNVSVPGYALMQLMSMLRMWRRGNVWARALRRQPNKRNENNLFSNFTI